MFMHIIVFWKIFGRFGAWTRVLDHGSFGSLFSWQSNTEVIHSSIRQPFPSGPPEEVTDEKRSDDSNETELMMR